MTEKKLPRATHKGMLMIGDLEIPCFVLENGERILSTRGVMKSLKRSWRGRKYSGTQLPVFLEANNLKPFISSDLVSVLSTLKFRTYQGASSEGFKAEILPAVCEIYLRAREERKLTRVQESVAMQCEILIRGFSKIGIIALVDEATGYQEIRDRKALQIILDKYLLAERAKWAKRFPDEFYKEIFRLRDWEWQGMKVNRPSVVGHYTNDIVWDRLAPGVHEELKRLNPKTERGRRKSLHHQWLTEDIGHAALQKHLNGVIVLMRSVVRAKGGWDEFRRRLQRVFPKINTNLELPLENA